LAESTSLDTKAYKPNHYFKSRFETIEGKVEGRYERNDGMKSTISCNYIRPYNSQMLRATWFAS